MTADSVAPAEKSVNDGSRLGSNRVASRSRRLTSHPRSLTTRSRRLPTCARYSADSLETTPESHAPTHHSAEATSPRLCVSA
jgi:hypothetical protein